MDAGEPDSHTSKNQGDAAPAGMQSVLAVISDLHVGKNDEFDIFRNKEKQELFASFLDSLRRRPAPVELVINGDLVDFLQLRPWDDLSRSAALVKIRAIVEGSRGVFHSLGEFLRDPRHRLRVLLGNHDVELAYPEVGAVVRDAVLEAAPEAGDRFELVDRRTTYKRRVNGVLVHIEHGNACDPWNAINYGPLFIDAEQGTKGFAYPPGTRFVYETMNRLKEQLHFVDVLKPEIPAVPLLLLALRPWQAAPALPEAAVNALRALANGLRAALRKWVAGSQLAPDCRPDLALEERLAVEAVRALIEELGGKAASPATAAALADDLELSLTGDLAEEEAVGPTLAPRDRLALRLATSALNTLNRFSARQPGQRNALPAARPGDPFAQAARSGLVGDVRVVVFGHTHEALAAEFPEGLYVNSGAWANLVRLPASVEREAVLAWLRGIADNTFERTARPTYVLVEPAGSGITVSLNEWPVHEGEPLWTKHVSM